MVHRLVGVLLWIQHPHHQVDELDHPIDLEAVVGDDRVVIGQVEEHQAGEVTGRFDPVAAADAEPRQQRVGSVAAEHRGLDVVGGGAGHPDGRHLLTGDGIEQR